MTKVVNVLLMLLVTVLLLYGSTKWYIHHKTQQLMEALRSEVRLLGELKYGAIGSSAIGGEVSVDDISFVFRGNDTITIDTVALKAPSLLTLADALRGARRRPELPEQLALRIEGISVALDGTLMQELDRRLASDGTRTAVTTLLCDKGISGPAQYRALGYTHLKGNLEIAYEYSRDSTMIIDANLALPGVAAAKGALYLKGVDSLNPQLASKQRLPAITRADITYRDDGYSARTTQHCARAKGMSADDYIEAAASQSDSYYLKRWGFAPGQGLRWAYRTFLSNPGTLHAVIRPPETLEFSRLPYHSAANLPTLLNLEVEVNGHTVHDLTIAATTLTAESGPAQRPAPTPPSDWRAQAATIQQRGSASGEGGGARRISAATLPAHIGSHVRIVLRSGAIREGWLTAASDTTLQIEQRLHNGSGSMAVARDSIDYIEIR